MKPPSQRTLRIVVVNTVPDPGAGSQAADAQAHRNTALRIGLLESGYDIVASLPADIFLPERIAQIQPDMIIIDSESDARDVLEHIVIATRDEPRPIVLFTEDDSATTMEAATMMLVSIRWSCQVIEISPGRSAIQEKPQPRPRTTRRKMKSLMIIRFFLLQP